MKHLLLCISILFLTVLSNAQELRVVKDNINCSYGLKDKTGNWIIEPIYILIQEYNSGYFLVKDALGDGLMSPSGKWIIECKYDKLYPAQPQWQLIGSYPMTRSVHPPEKGFFFYAHSKDRKLLLNSRGKEICEVSSLETLQFDGDAHILIYGNGRSTTSYLDTSGNVLVDQLPGVVLPFGENEFSLHGKETERNSKVMSGDVRLINRKGEYELEKMFDRAILVEDRICFEQDSKYGEISTSGKLLIEPQYKRLTHLSSSPYVKDNWVIYTETEQAGLMKPDGTIIINPIYNQLASPIRNRDSKRIWLAKKNGLTGIFNNEGKTILPIEYDEIIFVYDFSNEENVLTNFIVKKAGIYAYICPTKSYSPTTWYDKLELSSKQDSYNRTSSGLKIITKKKEKFGALNLDGTVLSECVFDGHAIRIPYPDRHFFWKNLNVYEFNFVHSIAPPKKWDVSYTKERTILLTDSRYYISGKLSETKDKIVRLETRNGNFDLIGNMMIVDRGNYGNWEAYNIQTNEKIELNNVEAITVFTKNKLLLRTREGYYGILSLDGEMLVKPIYDEIRHNSNSTYLWALTEVNEDQENHWVLIDEKGGRVISDPLKEPFRVNSGDILVTNDELTGLFDTETFKWKIQPIYPCLFKSAGEFYIAAYAQNKKGILSSDGKVILPLAHESIQVFTQNQYEKDGRTLKARPEIRWMVTDGEIELLVDQKGNQIKLEQSIRVFKESLLFGIARQDPFKSSQGGQISEQSQFLLNESNGIRLLDQSFFHSPNDVQNRIIRNFPILDYSNIIAFSSDSTEAQIRSQRQSLWSNHELKKIVFDTINSFWKQGRFFCGDRFGRFHITVKQESTLIREFKEDCDCAKQNHFQRRGYNFSGSYYRLDTLTDQFVSITFGQHPYMEDRFMTMSQPPPPPPPAQHMNFVYHDGLAKLIQLNDIFPSDSVLLQEFILALQQRDDLKLDCSSLESMVTMINRRFSLSEKGVHLYYVNGFDYWHNDAIEFLIPLERLKLHSESKWIVPILTSTS